MEKVKKNKHEKKLGRPSKVDEVLVSKLLQGFKMGFNDTECCAFCDISRELLYKLIRNDKIFHDKMLKAKEHPFLMAKQTVMKSMGKFETAKWYLEKRRRDEFGEVKKIEFENLDEKFAAMSVEEKAKKLLADEE